METPGNREWHIQCDLDDITILPKVTMALATGQDKSPALVSVTLFYVLHYQSSQVNIYSLPGDNMTTTLGTDSKRHWISSVLKYRTSVLLSAGVMVSQGKGASLIEEGKDMQMLSEAGFLPKAYVGHSRLL